MRWSPIGTFASKEMSGSAVTIAATRARSPSFVTAGEGTFRVWLIDSKKRKLRGINVKFGKIRRDVNCIVIDDKDEYIYCGTTSGDIVKARWFISFTKFSVRLCIDHKYCSSTG